MEKFSLHFFLRSGVFRAAPQLTEVLEQAVASTVESLSKLLSQRSLKFFLSDRNDKESLS